MIALTLALAAHAQEGTGWRPAAGTAFGRGGTITESARVEEGDVAVGATAMVADGERTAGLALVIGGSVAAGDDIRFDLSIPTWPFAQAPTFSGPATGDASLQALVPIARGSTAFSAIARAGLPTATDEAMLERGPSGGLLLALTGGDRLEWTLDAGPVLAASRVLPSGRKSGSSIALAGVGAWRARPGFRIGLEGAGNAGLGGAVSSGDALGFAQVRQGSGLALAVAGGLAFGPEAPTSRLSALLSFAPGPPAAPPDPDADGITTADQCPTAAEDMDGWIDEDGCPEADNDGDTVADGNDLCPILAGPASAGGCPDTDSDGRHDGVDRCPAVAGPARERADIADGCPKQVWATERRIELARPLRFDLSGHLEEPNALAEVAAYLLAHPELGPIEVAGHMAGGWSESEALGLSRVRAERVQAALMANGLSDERITAVGYGDTRPLDTNRLSTGRARNERIEIVLRDSVP
jgi:hypothetical protein